MGALGGRLWCGEGTLEDTRVAPRTEGAVNASRWVVTPWGSGLAELGRKSVARGRVEELVINMPEKHQTGQATAKTSVTSLSPAMLCGKSKMPVPPKTQCVS